MGHRSVGADIDPLAVLITKVWTNSIDVDEIREKSRTILQRAKTIWHSMPSGKAYPPNADADTRKFLRYWFDACWYRFRRGAPRPTKDQQFLGLTAIIAEWRR
jgi:hypothetical protein